MTEAGRAVLEDIHWADPSTRDLLRFPRARPARQRGPPCADAPHRRGPPRSPGPGVDRRPATRAARARASAAATDQARDREPARGAVRRAGRGSARRRDPRALGGQSVGSPRSSSRRERRQTAVPANCETRSLRGSIGSRQRHRRSRVPPRRGRPRAFDHALVRAEIAGMPRQGKHRRGATRLRDRARAWSSTATRNAGIASATRCLQEVAAGELECPAERSRWPAPHDRRWRSKLAPRPAEDRWGRAGSKSR